MDLSLDSLRPLLPLLATAAVLVAALIGANRLLRRASRSDQDSDFRNKLVMLVLSLAALVVLLVAAPFPPETRGQLLGFLGIVLSAMVALSSTTILGNAMAGIMQRAVGNFRVGDFVRVESHFGRVTERGLFHTEIQTEERDLVTLPNLYLVTNPVNVIRSSGHIVRATVSLGYDVPRGEVVRRLLDAASEAELEDGFVHVTELGDFSVSYRVGGLLKNVKSLLTARSRLRAEMLDALHGAGIEIVSPTFMNQRQFETERTFLPAARAVRRPAQGGAAPEEVAFDKAEQAETLEALRAEKAALAEEAVGLKSEDAAGRLEAVERRIAMLDGIIAAREARKPDGSD